MPLTEKRRQQLDGIVAQMEANGEAEADIRFVVGDFKQKYEAEAAPPAGGLTATIGEHLGKAFEATNPLSAIRQAPDFARGALSEVVSTVYNTDDLLRRAIGRERIIDQPDIQAAMTAPPTPAGEAGKVAGGAALFAAPVARVATATKALPWAARMAAEGLTGSGIAAMQTGGDPASMAIGAVAPAGLSAVGKGAVAVVGRTVPGALRARVLTTQALRPRNTKVKFEQSANLALPEIKAAEIARGKPTENLVDFIDVTQTAMKQNRAQYKALVGPRADEIVDLSPVADAMDKSIPFLTSVERPAKAEAIKRTAQIYRERKFTVEETAKLLQDTNAVLDSYYDKIPTARGKARSHPKIAPDVAKAEGLRDQLYKALDEPGQGAAAREIQRRWGAMNDLLDAAYRRKNVADRAQKDDLTERLSKVGAAYQFAKSAIRARIDPVGAAADVGGAIAARKMAAAVKEAGTTDSQIRRAMAAVRDVPGPIEMPPPPVPRPVPVRQGEIVEPQPQVAGPAPYAEGRFYEPAQVALPATAARPMPPSSRPDPSYVRAVPATPAPTMRQPRALPPPPVVREMPARSQAPKDPSYVRALQGKYAEKVERRPPTMTAEEYAEIDRLRLVQPEEAGRADWNVEHSIKPPQMFQAVLDDAKKHGFAGSPRELRSLYNQAVEDANSVMASMASAQKGGYHPDVLLQEIRRRGGLNIAKEEAQKGGGGLAGELKWFAEGARGKGGRAGGNLGSGIVRSGRFASDRGGLDVDNMATQLQQIPALAPYIKDANDLLAALRDAHTFYMTGGSAKTGRMSLPKALEFMGVRPGTNWWKQAAKQLEEEISFPPLE